MLFNLPRRVAGFLKARLDLTSEEEQVALYSLEVLIYTAYAFLGAGLAGWLGKCFWETLIIAATIFFLRCFSGGAHSESPVGCVVLSMVVIPFSAKIAQGVSFLFTPVALGIAIIFSFICSLVICFYLAPVDSLAKPVFSEKHRRQLKILSVLAVIFIFFLQTTLLYLISFSKVCGLLLSIQAGLLWQIFSLTSIGRRFFTEVDNIGLVINSTIKGR